MASERDDLIENIVRIAREAESASFAEEAIAPIIAATISRLEAEVEAGLRERNATAARFARLHTIASKIRWTDLGLPAMNVASTQEGLTELSQFLLQDALEECLDRQGLPRTEGERLWLWFSLSYARWLTLPRVLMHEMPDEWQGKMAGLLEEFDREFPDWCQQQLIVTAKEKGRFQPLPEVLCEYRHPDKAAIDRLHSTASRAALSREEGR